MLPPELERAYRQTSYLIEPSDAIPICLRIGERNETLDELLAIYDAHTWAFITAFNPRSAETDAAENDRRQKELVKHLVSGGYRLLAGRGRGDDARWPAEESVFVFAISPDEARRIGRAFRQWAVVVGVRGGAPRLLDCD